MNKNEIFNEYCRVIEEDGTKDDLKEVYESHSQSNPEILKQACETISEYVSFCMNICTFYWSEKKQKYTQVTTNDLDKDNWLFSLHYDTLYKINRDTDLKTINYPNIERMMSLHHLDLNYTKLFYKLLNNEL